MNHFLVILSFILASLINHLEKPSAPGGSNADRCYTTLHAVSNAFVAENPDTDLTYPGAATEITRTDLTVSDIPATVMTEQEPVSMRNVQIMHLDRPPPA